MPQRYETTDEEAVPPSGDNSEMDLMPKVKNGNMVMQHKPPMMLQRHDATDEEMIGPSGGEEVETFEQEEAGEKKGKEKVKAVSAREGIREARTAAAAMIDKNNREVPNWVPIANSNTTQIRYIFLTFLFSIHYADFGRKYSVLLLYQYIQHSEHHEGTRRN